MTIGNCNSIGKKTRRTRRDNLPVWVYLSENAIAIINEWGGSTERDDYVFFKFPSHISEEEFYIKKNNIVRSINGYLKKIGKNIGLNITLTSNIARHSYATILKNNAIPIAQISENLGHSSITMTTHYLNSFPKESLKNTSELLDRMVQKIG